MKKIFNKKIVLVTIIVLIVIGGLIFSGMLLTKIFPYLGGMKSASYISQQNERESFVRLRSDQSLKTERTQTKFGTGLKLIRKGSANIEVEKNKFYETLNKTISLAGQFNGNLINSQIYEENGKNSGYFTFMIPSKNFDNFVNKLNELGKIKNLSISTQDVSEEYFDLEGRLKILESQRTLLLSWLDKAKEIKDLLSIRTELQNIETEIETLKGRMNYINYHSEYSEISIFLTEKIDLAPFWEKSEILKRIIEGLTFALKSIINSIIFLIIFISFTFPWLFLVYLIYLLFKKYFPSKTK